MSRHITIADYMPLTVKCYGTLSLMNLRETITISVFYPAKSATRNPFHGFVKEVIIGSDRREVIFHQLKFLKELPVPMQDNQRIVMFSPLKV
jgi:hypothetical protein